MEGVFAFILIGVLCWIMNKQFKMEERLDKIELALDKLKAIE